MKSKKYLAFLFIAVTCLAFSHQSMASGDEDPNRVRLTAATKDNNHHPGRNTSAGIILNPESGNTAWAHNAWTYEIYKLNTDTPTIYTVTDSVDFQAFTGDFAPGDSLHLWVIQYPENRLRTINISTGETNVVAEIPVPLVDGIWTSLTIDKSTGAFYAIATDGVESVLYNVDPATGTITEAFGLGLQAVISSTFDTSGNLYIFDINSDSTFVVDVQAAVVTALGPAGFDGNYAQGMGYDPVGDEVYLAAYNNDQGPQLRILNRTTGETTLLTSLPGETGAFGFPAGYVGPQASAGPDATICEDQFFSTSEAMASGYSSLGWYALGDGTFENVSEILAVYHPGAYDIAEGSVELCLTVTGLDGATIITDCLILSIQLLPEVDAGPDATISYGEDFEITGATAQHYSSILWTSSGDGTFDDPASLLPVYFTGSSDLNSGQVELCLTSEPVGTCNTAAASCMNLTIEDIPSGIDFGDAPENTGSPLTFPTTMAYNGAAHTIVPSIRLGQKIDGEPDGQPSATALGDDTDLVYPSLGDDEDGVDIPSAIYQGTEVNITVNVSEEGFLDAWIDFNLDQAWLNPSEHIFVMVPLTAGNNQLSFTVPPATTTGQSYVRFRFRDYPEPLDAGGFAYNGEVEDYAVEIRASQAEEMDFGDAPSNSNNAYPTLFTQDGARHTLMEGIHLGTTVDAEPDGQPYSGSMGDDQDIYFPSQGDDEDGVALPETVQAGSELEIQVMASVDGFLDAWMDFNRDGAWNDEEHIFNTLPVESGVNALQVSVPENAVSGQTYLRFRFRDYDEPLLPTGPAENGEVEDHSIQVTGEAAIQYDFGDAPGINGLFSYPVLEETNGARHNVVQGILLGTSVDAEPDGQPSPDALGDDADLYYPSGGDDEGGVQFAGPLTRGATASLTVTVSVDGYLEAWIDFNRDGDWEDATEHIFDSEALSAGANTLTFDVLENAETGNTYARFRFCDFDANPGTGGPAENGEVEDYMILIQGSTQGGFDFGDAAGNGFPVLLDEDGARHAIDGITFMGDAVDSEIDGLPSGDAKGDDNSNLDDEDGVEYLNRLFVGSLGYLEITASANGYLNAWADFNRDGEWTGAGENIFDDTELSQGQNNLTIEIPETAVTGNCFMRFRFSSEGGLSFTGESADGEVEDYRATIYPGWNSDPTPVSHIVMIPAGLPFINSGDMLSVFYSDNGSLKPAGNMVYSGGQPGQLITFGDDPSTPDEKEGFATGEMIQWKLFDAGSGEMHDIQVEYDTQFPNHDGAFHPFGLSAITDIQYDTEPCPLPSGWDFTVTGFMHNVNIPAEAEPSILGNPLEPGDWIGAFYTNDEGNNACAGAGQWTDSQGIVVNVYGDDLFTSEKDGFAENETITWKIYRCSDGEVYEATAFYNPGMPCQGQFGDFCLSEITSLNGLFFRYYTLNAGWNSISSFLIPAVPDVETMFADYTDQLVIIKNLTSIYWPYAGVNTIGNWDNYSGYAVKMEAATGFKFAGESFTDNQITLDAGWHYLPILTDCVVDADEVFGPEAGKITIVQDLIGTKVWWPDQNVFTLETLEPGRAYKIRLTEETTLVFPLCDGSPPMKTLPVENISDEWLNRTPYSHTVAFPGNIIQKLNARTSIVAVDAKGNLYGILKPGNKNQSEAMVVFGDDPVTTDKEGFEEGEEMRFQLLNAREEYSTALLLEFDNMYGFGCGFAENGLSVVKSLEEVEGIVSSLQSEIMIFPNPSDGIFNVTGIDQQMVIELFDAFGEVLQDVPGLADGIIDLSGKPAGVYFIKIKAGSSVFYSKMILK